MIPKRIQFELVELQVVKLYGDYSLTDLKAINERCDFINEFITACGWTVEDYIGRMMGWVKLN